MLALIAAGAALFITRTFVAGGTSIARVTGVPAVTLGRTAVLLRCASLVARAVIAARTALLTALIATLLATLRAIAAASVVGAVAARAVLTWAAMARAAVAAPCSLARPGLALAWPFRALAGAALLVLGLALLPLSLGAFQALARARHTFAAHRRAALAIRSTGARARSIVVVI